MSAKKHGKGTNIIFTPTGGSAWVGVVGPDINEQGRAAAPIDGNEIDSDYQEKCPSEVPDLGSINFIVYHDPENPFPREGTEGVFRVEDPLTNPANNTRAFQEGDAFVEEVNTTRVLNDKMKTTVKMTWKGTNYTTDVEKTV